MAKSEKRNVVTRKKRGVVKKAKDKLTSSLHKVAEKFKPEEINVTAQMNQEVKEARTDEINKEKAEKIKRKPNLLKEPDPRETVYTDTVYTNTVPS